MQIIIANYNPDWPSQFLAAADALRAACGERLFGLEHFGSTAVPGLAAKPIIDILAGARALDDAEACIPALEKMGYRYHPEYNSIIPDRRFFNLGEHPNRTHNLHFVVQGGEFWKKQIAFRDHLRAHPDVARAYESLKRELAERYVDDVPGYTDAKSEFIRGVVASYGHNGV